MIQIVAHRGASGEAPENTMASARLGWEKNADAVECDVHKSLDGRVIVMHDATTSRTTGVARKIAETSSADLRQLDASYSGKGGAKNEKIPFLEELVATLTPGKRLFVEIKCGPEVLDAVRDIVAEPAKNGQIVIIGFELATMAKAKEMMPGIPVMWLRSTEKDKQTGKYKTYSPDVIRQAVENHLDGLDLAGSGLDADFAKKVREAGLQLHVWTIDDPQLAMSLADLGVDSITTNYPDRIRRVVEEPGTTAK